MADGIEIGGAGWRGGDTARVVTRIAATVRQDARPETRQQWVGAVRETPAQADQPAAPLPASRPADAAALDAARDSIAATLANTGTADAGSGAARAGAAATPIPIAPGASEDAVAAAQALAQLIAANAHPAIAGQARLDAHAVIAAIEAVE